MPPVHLVKTPGPIPTQALKMPPVHLPQTPGPTPRCPQFGLAISAGTFRRTENPTTTSITTTFSNVWEVTMRRPRWCCFQRAF
jgi:hypothetical protein